MNMKKRYPTYMAAGAFILFGVLVFTRNFLFLYRLEQLYIGSEFCWFEKLCKSIQQYGRLFRIHREYIDIYPGNNSFENHIGSGPCAYV